MTFLGWLALVSALGMALSQTTQAPKKVVQTKTVVSTVVNRSPTVLPNDLPLPEIDPTTEVRVTETSSTMMTSGNARSLGSVNAQRSSAIDVLRQQQQMQEMLNSVHQRVQPGQAVGSQGSVASQSQQKIKDLLELQTTLQAYMTEIDNKLAAPQTEADKVKLVALRGEVQGILSKVALKLQEESASAQATVGFSQERQRTMSTLYPSQFTATGTATSATQLPNALPLDGFSQSRYEDLMRMGPPNDNLIEAERKMFEEQRKAEMEMAKARSDGAKKYFERQAKLEKEYRERQQKLQKNLMKNSPFGPDGVPPFPFPPQGPSPRDEGRLPSPFPSQGGRNSLSRDMLSIPSPPRNGPGGGIVYSTFNPQSSVGGDLPSVPFPPQLGPTSRGGGDFFSSVSTQTTSSRSLPSLGGGSFPPRTDDYFPFPRGPNVDGQGGNPTFPDFPTPGFPGQVNIRGSSRTITLPPIYVDGDRFPSSFPGSDDFSTSGQMPGGLPSLPTPSTLFDTLPLGSFPGSSFTLPSTPSPALSSFPGSDDFSIGTPIQGGLPSLPTPSTLFNTLPLGGGFSSSSFTLPPSTSPPTLTFPPIQTTYPPSFPSSSGFSNIPSSSFSSFSSFSNVPSFGSSNVLAPNSGLSLPMGPPQFGVPQLGSQFSSTYLPPVVSSPSYLPTFGVQRPLTSGFQSSFVSTGSPASTQSYAFPRFL